MKNKELFLHNIAAKFIMGENLDLELEGKDIEIDTFYNLLVTSKNLKEALDNNHNLETISKLLEEKKVLTRQFQNLTNITWML